MSERSTFNLINARSKTDAGLGSVRVKPPTKLILQDEDGQPWAITVTTDGQLRIEMEPQEHQS